MIIFLSHHSCSINDYYIFGGTKIRYQTSGENLGLKILFKISSKYKIIILDYLELSKRWFNNIVQVHIIGQFLKESNSIKNFGNLLIKNLKSNPILSLNFLGLFVGTVVFCDSAF